MKAEFLEELEFGPDVLGPDSTVDATPLLALKYPAMTPPDDLALHENRSCDTVMHWYAGPMALEGYHAGWFRSEELTLYYVKGPENGPPLLFYPGQIDPWHSYQPTFEALSEHFTLYLMEHRGHGFSERSVPGLYRVVDYTQDAIQFIEHVIGEPAYITGHSLGGMMCMATWDLRPDLVRGLSIEDPPIFAMSKKAYEESFLDDFTFKQARIRGRGVQEGSLSLVRAQRHVSEAPMLLPPADVLPEEKQRARFVDWLMNRMGLGAMLGILPEQDRNFYLAAFDRYVKDGEPGKRGDYLPFPFLEPREEAWIYTDWRTSCSHFGGRWIEGWEERRSLASLSVPTIFWLSDLDISPIRTADDCEDIKSLLAEVEKSWEFILVDGAGHYIHKEETQRFTDAIVAHFLG
ncbi:MAG: alpha/beta hydrolase [Pseudomonadota bacterium]